jgi:hypothetical protein
MDILFTFVCVMIGIAFFSRAMTARAKAKKDRELLERSPDAWKRLQEVELAKRDRKLRSAGGAAITILKILMKK